MWTIHGSGYDSDGRKSSEAQISEGDIELHFLSPDGTRITFRGRAKGSLKMVRRLGGAIFIDPAAIYTEAPIDYTESVAVTLDMIEEDGVFGTWEKKI